MPIPTLPPDHSGPGMTFHKSLTLCLLPSNDYYKSTGVPGIRETFEILLETPELKTGIQAKLTSNAHTSQSGDVLHTLGEMSRRSQHFSTWQRSVTP